MKKIFALLSITIMLFCACQPTPEELVVQNKADDDLQKAIMQTAPPTTDTPQNTAEPSQELRITDTKTNNAGTVTVNIDANVALPGDDNITVARLKRASLTQVDVDKSIEIFFGNYLTNLTFYDPDVTTKSEIEAAIISLQKKMTDNEAMLNSDYAIENGITDIEDIKRHINEIIEGYKTKLADAPYEAPIVTDIDVSKGFSASVDFGGDYMGGISYSESLSSRVTFCCTAFSNEYRSEVDFHFAYSTTTQIVPDNNSSEFTAAKEAAEKLIDDMGIEGVRIGDVFIPLDNDEKKSSGTKLYVFCFERVVGNRTIDFSFHDGVYSDEYEVSVTVPYEQMQIWVYGGKVMKFYWSNPLIVTEIVNDNTALQIDYEQALELATNQIFNKYAYVEGAEIVNAYISGVEFEMVRLKERDKDNYISVPAWKFYGDVQAKLTDEHVAEMKSAISKSEEPLDEDSISNIEYLTAYWGPNIITVNALDGSIIDIDKGY